MTRVLIADDHPAYRRGLWLMLEGVEGLEVVGEAETGLRALTLAEQLQPDVVVMDLRMPDLDGIEATRQIVSRSPHVGVLVLTMFEDDDSVFAAMLAEPGAISSRTQNRTRSCGPSGRRRQEKRFSGPRSLRGSSPTSAAPGRGARGGGRCRGRARGLQGDEPQLAALHGQHVAVQGDRADLGMVDDLRGGGMRGHRSLRRGRRAR